MTMMALGGCVYFVWRRCRSMRISSLIAPAALAVLVLLGLLLVQTVLQVLATALLAGMALGALQGSALANRVDRYPPVLRVSSLAKRSLLYGIAVPKNRRDDKSAFLTRAVLRLYAVLIAIVCSGMLIGRAAAMLWQLTATLRRSLGSLSRLDASKPAIRVATRTS